MSDIPYDLIDMQAKYDNARARAEDAEAALERVRELCASHRVVSGPSGPMLAVPDVLGAAKLAG